MAFDNLSEQQVNKAVALDYRNKARTQLVAVSHNLKIGMNIFKQMRDLQGYYIQ